MKSFSLRIQRQREYKKCSEKRQCLFLGVQNQTQELVKAQAKKFNSDMEQKSVQLRMIDRKVLEEYNRNKRI